MHFILIKTIKILVLHFILEYFLFTNLLIFQDTVNGTLLCLNLILCLLNHIKLKLNSVRFYTYSYFINLLKNNFKTLLKYFELDFWNKYLHLKSLLFLYLNEFNNNANFLEIIRPIYSPNKKSWVDINWNITVSNGHSNS